MTKHVKTLILGILAGFSIALGGLLFTIATLNGYKVIGSIVFSIGLLLVCLFGFNLFTGKVGFTLEAENKKEHIINLLIMYVGNFIGAFVIGALCYGFFYNNELVKATITAISNARIINGDNWWVTLLGSIGCGMLVYTAVYAFKKDWLIGVRVLMLMFAVFAFVFAGFQHCIANMFYITFAMGWTGYTWLNILIVTVGNIVGALILEAFTISIKRLSNSEKGLE